MSKSRYYFSNILMLVMRKGGGLKAKVTTLSLFHELSHALTTPTTTPKIIKCKKSVVGTNPLRLLKFGGPSQT